MRISFEAQYSLEDFEEAISRALDLLRENGVEQLLYVNLYLSLRKNRRAVELVDDRGTLIDHLVIDGPLGQTIKLPHKRTMVRQSPTKRSNSIRKLERS